MSDVIDGEAVEVEENESAGELVPVQHHGTGIQVAPEVTAVDLVRRLDVIREAMRTAMQPDVDYGVIPGTGGKPTLLKPGSEKLGVLFQLDIQIENEKVFDGPHLTVMSKAVAYHAPTGTRLGAGEGMCSTREAKYAYRNAERLCPDCGEPQVREGKARDGRPGNWYCWRKQGGCGATWALDSPQGALFKAMEVGKRENPDLPDTWNTVLKMSEKRARIDAVLAVTGASALFTQDVEDSRESAPASAQEAAGAPAEVRLAATYREWVDLMTTLEVPRPEEWAAAAAEQSGVAKEGRMQRLNVVLEHFTLNEPKGAAGFFSVAEVQAGFAAGFDGVVPVLPAAPVEPEPGVSDDEDAGIEFAPELPLVEP
jgi:hypothetical protein